MQEMQKGILKLFKIFKEDEGKCLPASIDNQ